MLRSVKQLYGVKLGETDAGIGHVKDFYFDDQSWVIRYVIADTASWLAGRLVLISPHAFGNFHTDGDCLPVNLSRHQIENSPSIDCQKPVSRQYEEEYFRYYGWPAYWDAGGMWGVAGLPVAPQPQLMPDKVANLGSRSREGDDPHLRSTQSLTGYHIQATDGAIGHVTDFIMDDRTWSICHLVVETGHWFSGREIVICPDQIDSISYDQSKVLVNVTMQTIKAAHEYHAPPPGLSSHVAQNLN